MDGSFVSILIYEAIQEVICEQLAKQAIVKKPFYVCNKSVHTFFKSVAKLG
jgi:hypothetical protein